MREIIRYEALDGKLFAFKEECIAYEKDHPFLNPKEIKFYSINGKKIKDPNENVFIDSNRFIAYTERGLNAYQEYCKRMGIKVPEEPQLPTPYPLHYMYTGIDWICIEGRMMELQYDLKTCFLDEYEDNEEDHHNLVDNLSYEEA